jgi:hypothetical protein
MRILSALLALSLATAAPVAAQASPTRRDTVFVSDRFFADSTTTGARIVAKFESAEARAALLGLQGVVTTANGRQWVLGDILVHLDLVGNGYVATWSVAGPRSVVEAHLARVRELTRDRKPIYDHGIYTLVVRCACG